MFLNLLQEIMSQKIKVVLEDPQQKKLYNEKLFTVVAPCYDFVTKALSFGQDYRWKKCLIQSLPSKQLPYCIDLACGTGDITFALAKKFPDGMIEGIDLTPSMLALAQAKNRYKNVLFKQHDMCQLPYPDNTIDIITGSYALRNAPDVEQALAEISRVLKPGGTAAFLDFSKPQNRFLQKIEYALLKGWGSVWGIMLHRDARVYAYIAESLATYPDRKTLRLLLNKHELEIEKTQLFLGGFLELLVCKKRK